MQDLMLNLANQGLETLQTDSDQPTKILNLRGNALQNFQFLQHFPRLVQLDLSECGLVNTHDFANLLPQTLRLLRLSGNRIGSFDSLDDFQNIKTLDISGNPIADGKESTVTLKLASVQRLMYTGVSINPLTLLIQILKNRYGEGEVSTMRYSLRNVHIQISQDRKDSHLVEIRVQAETEGTQGETLLLFQVTQNELELVQRVTIDSSSRQIKKPIDTVYKVQLNPDDEYNTLLAALVNENSYVYQLFDLNTCGGTSLQQQQKKIQSRLEKSEPLQSQKIQQLYLAPAAKSDGEYSNLFQITHVKLGEIPVLQPTPPNVNIQTWFTSRLTFVQLRCHISDLLAQQGLGGIGPEEAGIILTETLGKLEYENLQLWEDTASNYLQLDFMAGGQKFGYCIDLDQHAGDQPIREPDKYIFCLLQICRQCQTQDELRTVIATNDPEYTITRRLVKFRKPIEYSNLTTQKAVLMQDRKKFTCMLFDNVHIFNAEQTPIYKFYINGLEIQVGPEPHLLKQLIGKTSGVIQCKVIFKRQGQYLMTNKVAWGNIDYVIDDDQEPIIISQQKLLEKANLDNRQQQLMQQFIGSQPADASTKSKQNRRAGQKDGIQVNSSQMYSQSTHGQDASIFPSSSEISGLSQFQAFKQLQQITNKDRQQYIDNARRSMNPVEPHLYSAISQVVQYSIDPNVPYKIRVKKLITNAEPTFAVLSQKRVLNSPGISVSTAGIKILKSGDFYDLEINFSDYDRGKLMLLLISFGQDIQELVPLTFQPVSQVGMGDAHEYTASVMLIDPGRGSSTRADFKINGSEFVITTKSGNIGGTSQANLLPIRLNDGNVNPTFLSSELKISDTNEVMLQTLLENSILRANFEQCMTNKTGMFLEKRIAKKCGCQSGDSQYYVGLSYLGYVHLFYFTDFSKKLEFCWNVEKQAGELFSDTYELQSYRQRATQQFNFEQYIGTSAEEYRAKFQQVDAIFAFESNKATFEIRGTNLPKSKYLAILGQDQVIHRIQSLQGSEFSFAEQDIGLKAELICGFERAELPLTFIGVDYISGTAQDLLRSQHLFNVKVFSGVQAMDCSLICDPSKFKISGVNVSGRTRSLRAYVYDRAHLMLNDGERVLIISENVNQIQFWALGRSGRNAYISKQ